MKKLLLILLCVPFIGISQERYHYNEVEFNKQSQTYFLKETSVPIKNGVIFSGKKRIKAEEKIVNGKVVSLVKYYRNGNMEMEFNLEDNGTSNCICEGNGFEKQYFKNGELAEEGSVKNNLEDGYWKYYLPGNVMEVWYEGNYINGKKDGLFKLHKSNGTIKETRFKNGKKIK